MNKNEVIVILAASLALSRYTNKRRAIAIKRLCELNVYYASKMDEAGVELTEFDQIAINAI